MAKKEFKFRGKTLEDLQAMSLNEFAELIPSRERRKIKRGFSEQEKILLKKIQKGEKRIKTHCRDMVIIPAMVGESIKIHTGKVFEEIIIDPFMVGHRLGEFAMSRKRAGHSVPGVGKDKKK